MNYRVVVDVYNRADNVKRTYWSEQLYTSEPIANQLAWVNVWEVFTKHSISTFDTYHVYNVIPVV